MSSAWLTTLMLDGCSADAHLSFLDPQGPVATSQRVGFVEMLALLLAFVAIPVFLLTPWILWRYRYGAKSSRYSPAWEYSAPLEIASWLGPVLIVLLLAILVWRDTHALDPYKPLSSAQPKLHVQVIGYDWKWLFIYPDLGIASIGMLALPAGRPIAMQLTSATVMQSLHIPALGSQIYAMGGMVTQLHLEADRLGTSMGDNTMYSGDGFHQQHFSAVAMTPEDFDKWVLQVRANGIALTDKTLNIIAKRSTGIELLAALSRSGSTDSNLYFRDASAAVFPAVVMATMGGAMAMPTNARDDTADAVPSTPTRTLLPMNTAR